MQDYITGMTGDYVRLSVGEWVKKSGVNTYTSDKKFTTKVTAASYQTGAKWDSLTLDLQSQAAAVSSFDGETLKICISSCTAAAVPKLPDGALIKSVTAEPASSNMYYTLALAGPPVDGYYIEKTAAGIVLNIKRPVKAPDGEKPLSGINRHGRPGTRRTRGRRGGAAFIDA
jgi:hypothetical protein